MVSIPLLRRITDASFYHFVRICGGYVKQGEDISPHIHRPLCDFITDPSLHRTAIAMPRIWRKSTVFTKWRTIYAYLQNPEARQLIAAENERIAADFLLWIQRQLTSNPLLRKIYHDRLGSVDEQWTRRNRWSTTAMDLPREGIYSEPSIRAIGVGGAAQSGHYTRIAIDDLVGKQAMESQSVLDGVKRWFDNVDELLVEPDHTRPTASNVDLVGTFWGPGDFFCYVQEKYPTYQWRVVPALKDTELKDEANTKWIQHPEAGHWESNYPEVFSTDSYIEMQLNSEKQQIFWSQHQNNPNRASGTTKFSKSWFRFYHIEEKDKERWVVCEKDDGTDGESFPLRQIPLYGIIDPGGFSETKVTKGGSRTAILIGGQAPGSIKKFVLYTWAGKFQEPEKFIDEVFKAQAAFRPIIPRCFRIEVFGQQQYIYRDIQEARRKRGVFFPISPLPKDVNKNVKDDDITALVNRFYGGEIYIHRSMKDLMAELLRYPISPPNDLADCLGKLNKYYWSRREAPDYKKKQAWPEPQRSSITGY